jgi:cyclopropane fatty-acyl-phospholipid synthase-like methyltransferase
MIGISMGPRFRSEQALVPGEAHKVLTTTGFGYHYTDETHPVVVAVKKFVEQAQPESVLDIAAGRGIVSLAIARLFPGTEILATDIDETGLKAIDDETKTHRYNIQTQLLDIATKKFPEALKNRFELVVAKDVYPFLNPQQITRFLQNAVSALKPGGWFLVTAPSDRSDLFGRAVKRNNHTGWYQKLWPSAQQFIPTSRSHFSFADIERLASQLKQNGLQMTEAFHYGKAKGWITAIAQKPAVTIKES